MPKAKVREAVLLSLGLEPRPAVASIPYAEPGREFERRLTIAAAHIHQAGPLRPLEPSDTLGSPYAVTVSLPEFGAWARAMGWTLPEQFPAMETAQPPQPAPEAEAPALSASGSDAALPPLTTGDIAHCFAGLRWDEGGWKRQLGNKPVWLKACIVIPGQRGVSETRWNPVCIGAALERQGHVTANSMRARFQTRPHLIQWLDAWKTYEADYLDSD